MKTSALITLITGTIVLLSSIVSFFGLASMAKRDDAKTEAALQASQQFTRFWPSILVLVGYGFAFYLLALTLRVMPVGIVYAIWSGLGIALIALIGFLVFGQRLDWPAIGLSHRQRQHSDHGEWRGC